MSNDKFIDIEEQEPSDGEYCVMRVVSYFKGWYMPSCKSWSWLMDDSAHPTSQVVAWKKEKPKEETYEFLQSDTNL